jgi:alpha-glucosidase (family GH31 glycosyl hydrolase)
VYLGYHRWAHYSWAWNHNSKSTQSDVLELAKGYADNGIPLGAINIDSTWATQFNNFQPDPTKFTDFPGLISELHSQGLRVILWATSMVNVENPDYQFAVDNNYLLRDVRGKVYPLHWWHGDGGLLDYTNPEGLAWWHSRMDTVLDAGVDGFKCDGTDPYIDEYILTGGAYGYNDQKITYRQYADSYYGDFFSYTRQKRGEYGVIMSRPTDCLIDPVTKFCTNFSPKTVMYSGWVGDDDAT